MEIYNGHVVGALISDLLSKIETKLYFFFKGDRSFDCCSRSYFCILLSAYIIPEGETKRKKKRPFHLDKKHLATKQQKKSVLSLCFPSATGYSSKRHTISACKAQNMTLRRGTFVMLAHMTS